MGVNIIIWARKEFVAEKQDDLLSKMQQGGLDPSNTPGRSSGQGRGRGQGQEKKKKKDSLSREEKKAASAKLQLKTKTNTKDKKR